MMISVPIEEASFASRFHLPRPSRLAPESFRSTDLPSVGFRIYPGDSRCKREVALAPSDDLTPLEPGKQAYPETCQGNGARLQAGVAKVLSPFGRHWSERSGFGSRCGGSCSPWAS